MLRQRKKIGIKEKSCNKTKCEAAKKDFAVLLYIFFLLLQMALFCVVLAINAALCFYFSAANMHYVTCVLCVCIGMYNIRTCCLRAR